MKVKPTLVVLAAGIGSRYGGLKQIDPIGPSGEAILDYSIYDAIMAGFGDVIFVIKESIEKDFREAFLDRLKDKIRIECVFQEIWKIPQGLEVPEGRIKPWGTGHAVMMAEGKVNGPFAVINADDFYSRGAYQAIARYYHDWTPARDHDYSMVGYRITDTLSDFGTVSRGVCQTGSSQMLVDVVERTSIGKMGSEVVYRADDGSSQVIPGDSIVSMNFWGFTPSFFRHLNKGFNDFITGNRENPKAEFYIPSVVNDLVHSGKASVRILEGAGQWFGMTYREDRELVVGKIRELVSAGLYPENLWG